MSENTATVTLDEDGDSFTIRIGWRELNMLQRAIQRSPYEEMRGLWNAIIAALSEPEPRRP